VAVQHGLQFIDLAFVDRTFRQHHDIDAVDLFPGRDDQSAHKVQIQLLWRGKLKETEKLVARLMHRAFQGPEVGLSHTQGPGQE